MSKAAVFFEPGGPEVLRVAEVPDPTAGPGQVRVRVRAAGVQPFDVAVVAGQIHRQTDPTVPTIPGNEFAGVVDQVGAGVDGFAVGDEVLGYGTLNGYQELLAVGADQVTAKPAGMPWDVAGGFSAGAQTAHIALAEIGVGAGDTVLVHGAAGAVGSVDVAHPLWLAGRQTRDLIGAIDRPAPAGVSLIMGKTLFPDRSSTTFRP